MAMVTLRQNKIMMLQTWGFYFYLLILHMKEMENERCQMPAKVQIATGSKCTQKYRQLLFIVSAVMWGDWDVTGPETAVSWASFSP